MAVVIILVPNLDAHMSLQFPHEIFGIPAGVYCDVVGCTGCTVCPSDEQDRSKAFWLLLHVINSLPKSEKQFLLKISKIELAIHKFNLYNGLYRNVN